MTAQELYLEGFVCSGKEAYLHLFLVPSPDLARSGCKRVQTHGLEGNRRQVAWDETMFVPLGQRAPEELLADPEQRDSRNAFLLETWLQVHSIMYS